jgi:amino acid transporter
LVSAGNAVTGSAFYSIPAVLSAAGVYSPISLFIACLLIGPFRPIILELSSALGANDSVSYAYYSNISTRAVALFATALDALATGAVSASTAAAYLNAVTAGHVNIEGWTVILLAVLTVIAFLGLRDSSNVALGMISLHLLTMLILIVFGIIFWATEGSSTLVNNWKNADLLTGGKTVARALFDGVAIGFVGLTGFECTPSYVTRVKDGQFAKALFWMQVIIVVSSGHMNALLCAMRLICI